MNYRPQTGLFCCNPLTFAADIFKQRLLQQMKLSQLSETLIGSEIVKLGGEIREKIRQGERIFNFTVGDFDPSVFPIPKELEDAIVDAYRKHFTNYPAAEGTLDLREALGQFMKDRQGLDYTPAEILVAGGGCSLFYSLFRSIFYNV